MSPLNSQRGQILIEAVYGVALVALIGSTLLFTIYAVTAKSVVGHLAHQALICVESELSEFTCSEQLRDRAEQIIPFGQVQNLSFNSRAKEISFEWQTTNLMSFNIHRSLK